MVIDIADTPCSKRSGVIQAGKVFPGGKFFPELSLLDQLRGTGVPRPKVDPEFAGGLREWLEDSLAGPAGHIGRGGQAVRVGARLVSAPLIGSAHDEILTSLVRCVFRQWITSGVIHRPLEDALEALSAWGDRGGIVEAVNRLDHDRRSALANQVANHASKITEAWPPLGAAWYPRTRERICVPLCGGRILLGAVVDLLVGTQANDEATVCLVQVGTTAGHHVNLSDLHFIALLETLRSGAPPRRVARYLTGPGELQVESVDEHMLSNALVKTVEVAERACFFQARAQTVESGGSN